MSNEINDVTELAYEGGEPLTTTPVVGTAPGGLASVLAPGTEPVAPGAMRVTVLGSGDPFVKASQASASVLVEVGNEERDFFFLDLGSGGAARYCPAGRFRDSRLTSRGKPVGDASGAGRRGLS
jgi:ribonuclease Z